VNLSAGRRSRPTAVGIEADGVEADATTFATTVISVTWCNSSVANSNDIRHQMFMPFARMRA